LFSKYIHTLKFSCSGKNYTSTIEDDMPHDEWLKVIARCKTKVFGNTLQVISAKTEERDEQQEISDNSVSR
jgi:hypothetical protein